MPHLHRTVKPAGALASHALHVTPLFRRRPPRFRANAASHAVSALALPSPMRAYPTASAILAVSPPPPVRANAAAAAVPTLGPPSPVRTYAAAAALLALAPPPSMRTDPWPRTRAAVTIAASLPPLASPGSAAVCEFLVAWSVPRGSVRSETSAPKRRAAGFSIQRPFLAAHFGRATRPPLCREVRLCVRTDWPRSHEEFMAERALRAAIDVLGKNASVLEELPAFRTLMRWLRRRSLADCRSSGRCTAVARVHGCVGKLGNGSGCITACRGFRRIRVAMIRQAVAHMALKMLRSECTFAL
jgi:hypothetical protein